MSALSDRAAAVVRWSPSLAAVQLGVHLQLVFVMSPPAPRYAERSNVVRGWYID
jgi:hypothetical protein